MFLPQCTFLSFCSPTHPDHFSGQLRSCSRQFLKKKPVPKLTAQHEASSLYNFKYLLKMHPTQVVDFVLSLVFCVYCIFCIQQFGNLLILIVFYGKSGLDFIRLWRICFVVLLVAFLWIDWWMESWPHPLFLLLNDAISYWSDFERHHCTTTTPLPHHQETGCGYK